MPRICYFVLHLVSAISRVFCFSGQKTVFYTVHFVIFVVVVVVVPLRRIQRPDRRRWSRIFLHQSPHPGQGLAAPATESNINIIPPPEPTPRPRACSSCNTNKYYFSTRANTQAKGLQQLQ